MTTPVSDDPGLAGKVAIVTGGGAAGDGIGNGRAAAILLALAGVKVLVVDHEPALAERTVAMIADAGGRAVAFGADVTEATQCKVMVEAAVEHFDFLDNNVGIASRGSVVTESLATWQRVMRINVESVVLASKHAIPAMMKTSGKGAIVNVSSISALRPRGLTALLDLEGGRHRSDASHGRRSRRRWNPGQLRGAGAGVRPDGRRTWHHERAVAGATTACVTARPRGHRLGRRARRQVPPVRTFALHHGPDARRRWRCDAAHTGARKRALILIHRGFPPNTFEGDGLCE